MFTPDVRSAALLEALLALPGVDQPKKHGFGSGLRVGGKVFAMLVGDRLVVKLPRQRVEALVASGDGEPFAQGGRMMKEWLAVELASVEDGLSLAKEAMAFVASGPR